MIDNKQMNKQSSEEITALKMMQTRQKLYELIIQLRKDASSIDDPNARILLDFSAEMMADLVHAFRQYENNIVEAIKKNSKPNKTNKRSTQ